MNSSRISALWLLLSLCLLFSIHHGFVLALLPEIVLVSKVSLPPQPPTCGRRAMLGILSGATVLTTTSTVAVASDLVSLESAASQLRNAEGDPQQLSHRLNYPHPGLRRKASPVTYFGSDLELVVDALLRTMETNASTTIQYGIDARIIVLKGVIAPNGSNGSFYNNKLPITVFCNPTILARSSEDKMLPWKEYCLVVGNEIVWPEGEAPKAETPGSSLSVKTQQSLLEVDLLRDETIEIAAQDVTGKPIRMSLSGEASRAFQHELDHLNGILIVDHASLEDLPPAIAFLEEPYHAKRQKEAFERSVYQGNGPLYY